MNITSNICSIRYTGMDSRKCLAGPCCDPVIKWKSTFRCSTTKELTLLRLIKRLLHILSLIQWYQSSFTLSIEWPIRSSQCVSEIKRNGSTRPWKFLFRKSRARWCAWSVNHDTCVRWVSHQVFDHRPNTVACLRLFFRQVLMAQIIDGFVSKNLCYHWDKKSRTSSTRLTPFNAHRTKLRWVLPPIYMDVALKQCNTWEPCVCYQSHKSIKTTAGSEYRTHARWSIKLAVNLMRRIRISFTKSFPTFCWRWLCSVRYLPSGMVFFCALVLFSNSIGCDRCSTHRSRHSMVQSLLVDMRRWKSALRHSIARWNRQHSWTSRHSKVFRRYRSAVCTPRSMWCCFR